MKRFATDPGQFMEIDLRRTALGPLGGKKEQTVKDPQLVETNDLLREIVKRLAGELGAVAA
ncbi:MAG: hypothetical protein ACREVK_05610 [Gammaproteobacteria bacterium]